MKKKEENPIINQVLAPEFLKQFKDFGELNSFMEDLYAPAMEQMIEGELDSHLGYTRHSPEGINSGNSRNGKTSKKVKTALGEVKLDIPLDRNSTFEPVLIPKRSRTVEGIEEVIISLYAARHGSDLGENIRMRSNRGKPTGKSCHTSSIFL